MFVGMMGMVGSRFRIHVRARWYRRIGWWVSTMLVACHLVWVVLACEVVRLEVEVVVVGCADLVLAL